MRWSKQHIEEVGEGIVRFGLERCSICSSQTIAISPYPFPMVRGGMKDHMEDEDTNVEFFMKLECTMCGHALFINSERYRGGDEPVFEQKRP